MSSPFFSKIPVTVFFLLTFIISWGAIFLIFGPGGIPATPELQEQIGMVILLGPAVAGLLLIVLYNGAKGLRQLGSKLVKWRVSGKWYALAVLIAPLSTLLGVLMLSLFTSGWYPAITTSGDISGLLLLGMIGGITVGLFEELGWTGFAVPRLMKKFSIYTTGIIVGIVWGAWHFILFWEKDSFSETIPFLLMLARLFSWLPAYRILMVWVYKNTQSLMIVVLMHASLVASLATLDPVIKGDELLIYILIRAAMLWGIVAILAISINRKKSDQHKSLKI